MTLGNALTAKLTLIVWCRACGHQAEPDVAAQMARYGADTAVAAWAARLGLRRARGRVRGQRRAAMMCCSSRGPSGSDRYQAVSQRDSNGLHGMAVATQKICCS